MTEPAAQDPRPEAALQAASAKQVARAVDRLGDADRELLNLVYRQRLTPAQAGLELSLPEASVRARLSTVLHQVGVLLMDTVDTSG
jgi:DNA-directed RNA polymerase specialized sigma24 family protein